MSTELHLISEIKRELDWAAEEVQRSEAEIMKLEAKFNKSLETADEEDAKRLLEEKIHLQDRIGLSETYALQSSAAKRFYMLSHLFDIAARHKSADLVRSELSNFIYRANDGKAENADQQDKLLEMAEALMAYLSDGHSDEADEAIREAWQNVEETLRGLGRKL